jgi:hypothetical protein
VESGESRKEISTKALQLCRHGVYALLVCLAPHPSDSTLTMPLNAPQGVTSTTLQSLNRAAAVDDAANSPAARASPSPQPGTRQAAEPPPAALPTADTVVNVVVALLESRIDAADILAAALCKLRCHYESVKLELVIRSACKVSTHNSRTRQSLCSPAASALHTGGTRRFSCIRLNRWGLLCNAMHSRTSRSHRPSCRP